MSHAEDLTGQQFNSFTVIKRAENKIMKNGRTIVQWKCQCECGQIRYLTTTELKTNKRKSCGCKHDYYSRINNITHGDSHTRLHNIWLGIKERCFCETDFHYKWYGGRGITMCDEWRNSYVNFKQWALENGYKDSLSIDRRDNNGNYCPSNCIWTDQRTQCNNRRSNCKITAFGATLNITQWAELVGLNRKTIQQRINNGYLPEEALLIPKRRNIDGHYIRISEDIDNTILKLNKFGINANNWLEKHIIDINR